MGWGYSRIYIYIPRLEPFLGFKVLNINIWCVFFQKNEYFFFFFFFFGGGGGYGEIVDILGGHYKIGLLRRWAGVISIHLLLFLVKSR